MKILSERQRDRGPLVLALMLVLHLCLVLLSARITKLLPSAELRVLLTAAFQILACVLPTLFYRRCGGSFPRRTLFLESIPPVLMFFVALALISSALQLNLFVCDLLPSSENLPGSSTLRLSGVGGVLLSLLCYVLVPAVCEELFYRGAVFGALGGGRFGILISAFCFSVTHFNLYGLLYTTVAGLVLAVCTAATGSIRLPVFVHAALNFVVIALSYAEERLSPSTFALASSLVWSVIFGAGVISTVYSLLNYGRVRLEREVDLREKNGVASDGEAIDERQKKGTLRALILPLIYIVLLILWQLVRLLP